MTNEEIKTVEALKVLRINELKEVTSKDLYYAHMGLSKLYDPNTTSNPKYIDGVDYRLVQEAYDYLSADICRTNETIRNIVDPAHKTYEYQPNNINMPEEEKMEYSEDKEFINSKRKELVFKDKPNALNITLAIFFPLYGVLNYFIIRKMMPKAAKCYLIIGIIGILLNFILMLI